MRIHALLIAMAIGCSGTDPEDTDAQDTDAATETDAATDTDAPGDGLPADALIGTWEVGSFTSTVNGGSIQSSFPVTAGDTTLSMRMVVDGSDGVLEVVETSPDGEEAELSLTFTVQDGSAPQTVDLVSVLRDGETPITDGSCTIGSDGTSANCTAGVDSDPNGGQSEWSSDLQP